MSDETRWSTFNANQEPRICVISLPTSQKEEKREKKKKSAEVSEARGAPLLALFFRFSRTFLEQNSMDIFDSSV